MGILTNQPFYHFWQTIVFVIFAGGPVLILVPGPGLALNGPDNSGNKFKKLYVRINSLRNGNKVMHDCKRSLPNFKNIILSKTCQTIHFI